MRFSSPIPSNQLPETEWLEGPHGRLGLSCYQADNAWMRLLISHGFSEHRGWWHHVAGALREAGVTCYTFDHYHHGVSAGGRGDIPDFSVFPTGVLRVLRRIEEDAAPELPLVLLGHSQGGLALLRALRAPQLPPIAGLALGSPLLGLNRYLAMAGWLMAGLFGLFAPGLPVPTGSHPRNLTSNRPLWPQYSADPLRNRSISARYFREMLRAISLELHDPQALPFPLLVLAAGDEFVVSPNAIRSWYLRVPGADKQWRYYPGLRHELFNEEEAGKVFEDLLDWLRQLPAVARPAPPNQADPKAGKGNGHGQ